MIHQIIYSSRSTVPMQEEELMELLEHARFSNESNAITGALVYAEGLFLQVLEGEPGAVSDLMTRISKDLRHENLTVLSDDYVEVATFTDWTMAYVSATPEQVASWAGLADLSRTGVSQTDARLTHGQAADLTRSILSLLEPD